ncbi:ABC transporter permease [Allonocardiopsis opalescens]|uniref:Peptide/nickel transport system permease protein n=1 Tax=Allonocardiopsis opalescens TaxID=1144618 RepID=A0A2T0Q9F2_9ACTN|nr:ABC transporter permease [Allonocardiopsis opalescens]PRY00467.1 peptide/nickel transport system permease protein [Allonocardiopsis opalescens]
MLRRTETRRDALVPAACVAVLALVAIGAVLAQLLPQLDPLRADFQAPLRPPGPEHWFGTDATGRDVFARTLAGGASSIVVAAMTVAVGLVVGGGLGVLAGFARGWVDALIGTLLDVVLALPGLITVMVVVTMVGPGRLTIGALIGLIMVPAFARIARSATLTVRGQEFVQAARIMGAPPLRIIGSEVVRCVLPAVAAYSFTAVTVAIVAEGSLSFLGFGLAPPTASWGGLIAEGRTHIATAPWICLAPAAVLCATVLAVNVLGERWGRSRP